MIMHTTESSHSGLVHCLGKAASEQSDQGFKSLTLRQKTKSGSEAKIWSARSPDCSESPQSIGGMDKIRLVVQLTKLSQTNS
jgi:hypothetical protein